MAASPPAPHPQKLAYCASHALSTLGCPGRSGSPSPALLCRRALSRSSGADLHQHISPVIKRLCFAMEKGTAIVSGPCCLLFSEQKHGGLCSLIVWRREVNTALYLGQTLPYVVL